MIPASRSAEDCERLAIAEIRAPAARNAWASVDAVLPAPRNAIRADEPSCSQSGDSGVSVAERMFRLGRCRSKRSLLFETIDRARFQHHPLITGSMCSKRTITL